MVPAHPPLPTAWNLPFHAELSGNQTSILMSESGDGVSVTPTRQNAGSIAYGLAWLPARPPRPPAAPSRPAAPARPAAPSRPGTTGGAGGVNAPAATGCADVTCAF